MNELKPCPFCGESGEEIQDYTYRIPGNIYIGIFYCRNCGGAMIDTDKNHCWLDRAESWNKRFCAEGKGERTMPDRGKVIRTIEGCINIYDYCNKCDYDGCVFDHGSCEKDLLADALALLKEQERLNRQ